MAADTNDIDLTMESWNRLELFRNKNKDAQSAVASQPVLEHLAGFLKSKRQGSVSQIHTIGVGDTSRGYTLVGPGGSDERGRRGHGIYSRVNPAFGLMSGGHVEMMNNGMCLDDDHPLRKTASMPTMHIQLKAQSSSRRKQMELRQTKSPLTRRRPRARQMLHSLGDSDTAAATGSSGAIGPQLSHLSNTSTTQQVAAPSGPISTGSGSNALRVNFVSESHGQSESPPPSNWTSPSVMNQKGNNGEFSGTSVNNNTNLIGANTEGGGPVMARSAASSGLSSKCIGLDCIYTSQELESFQSESQLRLAAVTSGLGGHVVAKPPNFGLTDLQTSSSLASSSNSSSSIESAGQSAGSQTTSTTISQHQRVNQMLRNTVIKRVSSKGAIMAGGSLDMEQRLATGSGCGRSANYGLGSSTGETTGRGPTAGREDMRQWSLDAADLKAATCSAGATGLVGSSSNQLEQTVVQAFASGPLGGSGVGDSNNSGNNKLLTQLNTMGVTQSKSAFQPRDRTVNLLSQQIHHQSSSSSSASSLVSQQDSLEEVQAIDLSSSSEAARQHRQQAQSHANMMLQTRACDLDRQQPLQVPPPLSSYNPSNSTTSILQESFKELHLFQPANNQPADQASSNNTQDQNQYQGHHNQQFNSNTQFEPINQQDQQNQLIDLSASSLSSKVACQPLNSTPIEATTQSNELDTRHELRQTLTTGISHQQQAQQQQQFLQNQHHFQSHVRHPHLSLGHHGHLMNALTSSYNLSSSAQNLLTAHQSFQQVGEQHIGAVSGRYDQAITHPTIGGFLVNPLGAATAMVPTTFGEVNAWMAAHSGHLIPANDFYQVGQISGSLLGDIIQLPEPLKSAIISHMIQQQQLACHRQQFPLTQQHQDQGQVQLTHQTHTNVTSVLNPDLDPSTLETFQTTRWPSEGPFPATEDQSTT